MLGGIFSPTKKKRPSTAVTQPPPPPVIFGPPEILPQDIVFDSVHDLLGDGQYGSVYKGRCRGLEVAVKKPHKQNLTDAQLTSFRHEVQMMSKISHPNVVRFMGACIEEGKLQIVTERCKINLEALLASSVHLTLYERMRMARDAALGMTWLHEIKMVHRDLKTANLLVDFNNRIKVADFGFSQIKESDSLVEPKGTLVWMAPEMILGARYTEKVDVYSFGIILWEILTREKPYPHYVDPQIFCQAICYNHERPALPANTPAPLARLITNCWNSIATERCSFSDIVFRLSEIMIDCVIQHEGAAQFWKKYFLDQDDKVEWEIFEDCLAKELEVGLFEVVDESKKPVERSNFVTMERFDKVVRWFGPIYDPAAGQPIINRITDLMQRSWFHGDISSIEANARLTNQPPGTFLIRFSSADPKVAPFTLSEAHKGHVRIERTKDGYKVHGKQYKSLTEFVESNTKQLTRSCPKNYEPNYSSVDEPVPASQAAMLP